MKDHTPDSEDNGSQPTPSQYMRKRRPHLFSDSQKTTEIALTREVLSHHLETLTKQKAETVFEGFAKRLAERFVAPNLRPQTGPTGGGDGKTDSETYPVAKEIAERWFVADQAAAASERWAFAFSAKEDWRGKVQSDVKEIAGTGRGYPRIYFITNQYVPAKKSAEVQDSLEKKFGIPVTILDRTWILDCVLERGSLDIAQECLGVGTQVQATVLGPRDLKRQTELDALEKMLADSTAYQGRTPVLADDALRAAKLARGFEKPRYEVDGRFERAVRLAREHGSTDQHLAAVYDWAWTSFFWFEDALKVSDLYDQVEKLAIGSQDTIDFEKLNNLLPLLINAVHQGMLKPEIAAIESRRAALTKALEAAKDNTVRPNNALHAHALLLMPRVTTISAGDDPAKLDEIWQEFTSVIDQSHGLGTFPFEPIAQALAGLGDFVPESPAFDKLYETLSDALAERQKEGTAAKLNSDRGYQKLNKGLHYDAIRWSGRAVGLLVKAEYEEELVEALRGCSIAYMEAGLFWAARNYALAAVTSEFRKFKQSGSVDDVDPSILSHWFECELQLGRVPFALAAYELGAMVRNARSRTQEQKDFADRHRIEQGNRLAAVMVGTQFDDLQKLKAFPAALDRLGLVQASTTLMFLMGGEEALREDAGVPEDETSEGIESLFNHMSAAATAAGFPKPDYLLDHKVVLQSRVLGCEIAATCENSLTSIGISEAILGALESLLATSLGLDTLPHLDRLRLRLQSKDDAPITPSLDFIEESGSTVAIITHRPKLVYASREEAEGFFHWLSDAVIKIFLTFAVPAEPDTWGKTVLAGETGFSRAITFSNVPTMYEVVFGDNAKLGIEHWSETGDPETAIKRASPWLPKVVEGKHATKAVTPGVGESPEGMFDPEKKKHSDYRIVSPIDARKWDSAIWRAVFFMCAPGSEMTPLLGLTFEQREPAAGIFEAWRERYGETDPDNNLRIAIITGVNISNPHAYAVIVGPNFDRIRSSPSDIVGFVARRNIMQPKSSHNLDMFLSEYRRLGRFELVPAHLTSMETPPVLVGDYGLEKYDLVVRPAWKITENDPDSCALDLDDPPVIPLDQPNAPVLKAMEQKAKFLNRRKKAPLRISSSKGLKRMIDTSSAANSAVQFLLDGLAPERKTELAALWEKYGPEFQLMDDDGPDGAFILEGGLFRLIRFNHRVLRLFWFGSFIAWEGYVALHTSLISNGEINLQRFKELLNVFTQILTAADSTTVALPAGIPEPGTFPTDPEARAPAELAIFCSGWALLHEFKHIQHQQDGTSAPYEASADEVRSEEFSCDEFATEYILSTVSKYAAESSDPEDKVHFKRALGIYFALFTMTIIAKDRWSETDTHPSLQARISNIRKHMGPENLQLADAIAYAAFAALRVLWPNAPSPLNGQSPLP